MNHLRAIGVILFVLLVIIVAVQNYQSFSTPVMFKINLIFFSWESSEMSLYFVSIITFLIGIVCSGAYGMTERFRLKKQVRVLSREAKERDKELNSLRNLPVTAEDMGADETSEER